MEETKSNEEKLIKQLIPRITEFFTKNKTLEKGKLKELITLLEFPNIPEIQDTESFWKEISKNSSNKNITKELFMKNLTEYIHNHSKEIFEQESALINNVTQFLERPVQLVEDFDPDNELIFEFYRLLATIEFFDFTDKKNSQSISLTSLQKYLNEYKFINLTKESINDLIEELLKQKSSEIKIYDYLEIMEKMNKEYHSYKLEKYAEKKLVFLNEDLDQPELNGFINLLSFIKILLEISGSILICHEKSIKVIKNNDVLNAEYLNRNFLVLVNNMKLYCYEIMRIYHEQKQKFEYFICANISKIAILKQEIKDLEEKLKAKDYDDNDNILKTLYDEVKNEKKKNEDLFNENQTLKKQISDNNDKLYDNDYKIQEMKKVIQENEGKINMINKEKELQKEKYKNVFDQLNSILLMNKEKEQRLNECIEKMNLSPNLLHLVNLEKVDIISYINDKDKYYASIDNKNKTLKNRIIELEKDLQKNAEEISDLKYKNDSLNKKNEMLQKEIDDSKKEVEEQTEKSFFLNSVIDDKVDKEDYDNLEHQLNEEKEKNSKMKKDIDKLNEEISKKEEDIIRSKNKINSQENIIKENESKINALNEQIKLNDDKYNELLNKYKSMITKLEEDERNFNNAIDNLNLSEKYQQLVKMEKPELIKIIIDKDSYISKIETENITNKSEINELNKKNQELNDEITKNKATINDLNLKIISTENELKEINNNKIQLEKNLQTKEDDLRKEREEKEKLEKNLSEEKKKNELLMNDNKIMKNEIISQKENISKANNEISSLQNKNTEKEEQINSLTKEKDILNKNYKELLDKYNEQLANTRQKEQRTSIAIQNLNLSGEYLKLANMSKDQLISLIVEKDKYLKMTEDLNKDLNEKIEKINKEKNMVEDECNKLKLDIVDLEKKNSLLNEENEHINKDKDNLTTEKNNLISDLQKEKDQKEIYIKEVTSLKEEITKLNQSINTLKEEIQKLTTENKSKDETISNLENKINTLQSQLNDIEKQKSDLTSKYKELIEKSNIQLEKIKSFNLKEKNELDLISKLYLTNQYQSLSSKPKADLISLIIEKDNLIQKFEKEKEELNNKVITLDKSKIELEKNISDFEAKNNTLNNKIKNLEQEINTVKTENENLIKEKNELNNMLKEEKKLGEKMKSTNDLLNKENTRIEVLIKENKKLTDEINTQKELITKLEKDIANNKKNLEEKENKNIDLNKEIESLNSKYNELIDKYNSQNIIIKNKEKSKDNLVQTLQEKYKYLQHLSEVDLIKAFIEKDTSYINLQDEHKKIKNENSSLTKRTKELEDLLNKAKGLKQKYITVFEKYQESEKAKAQLTKERDEYKIKYDKLFDSMVKKDKEPKIFKSNLLALINTSQFILKKQIKKVAKKIYQEEKIYDYLCLRLERKIIDTLKDSLWDGKTVFTESIKYIDEKENTFSDCIVFITNQYFYLFNYKYKCCFASPLIELALISITNSSNYICFFFQRSEAVIIECFRVLELVNFMKLLQARQKSLKFSLSIEPFIHTQPNEVKKKNFIECLYYGKAAFSGSFQKQVEGLFTLSYEERFGVLCEIGLIILESATGKPKQIINLLFADFSRFNTREGNNGLAINIRGQIYKFIFDSEQIRNEWEKHIKTWKANNSLLTKFNS